MPRKSKKFNETVVAFSSFVRSKSSIRRGGRLKSRCQRPRSPTTADKGNAGSGDDIGSPAKEADMTPSSSSNPGYTGERHRAIPAPLYSKYVAESSINT